MSGLPTSLGGIRPAQAGIVLLGRPACGQIAATIIDLALRDVLRVEQLSNGAAADWLVTLHSRSSELAAYEKVLLEALFGDTDRMWLSELTGSRAAGMRRVAAALRRDAIRAGWLGRWHKGEQTKQGERLRRQIRSFEQELLDNGLPAEASSFRQLLPYAMVVGLVSRPEQVPPIYHPLVSFALAWTSRCETIPGWRPRLGPVEPSSSFDEHYFPPPAGAGGDGGGMVGM